MSLLEAQAVILRGLPGSGKSRYAKRLEAAYLATSGLKTAAKHVFSTDEWFYQQGSYCFDKTKLADYHQLNLESYKSAIATGNKLVICDNTNMALWEFEGYLESAQKAGYVVDVITVGEIADPEFQKTCAERNRHQVSIDVIKKMAAKYQPYQSGM